LLLLRLRLISLQLPQFVAVSVAIGVWQNTLGNWPNREVSKTLISWNFKENVCSYIAKMWIDIRIPIDF